jgi:catechol 2,3-dioxygenase-like lactoylglutathione lyase family enzyme
MTMIRFKGPAAYVADLTRSRAFYEGLLDFAVNRVMKRGETDIAIAYKAGFSIWLASDAYWSIAGDAAAAPKNLGAGNWENAFETADFEIIYERLTKAGASFVHPLRELPWGQRGFRVHDPDGHIIDISETHGALVRRLFKDGRTKDSIAAQVSISRERIDAYIAGED